MNKWSQFASYTLIAGAIGHFFIVDLAALHIGANFVKVTPENLLGEMKEAEINFGPFGNNIAFKILSGFSFWMVVSLIVIAIYNLFIFRHLPVGHKLRFHSLVLGMITSVIFLTLASLCFIYPAAIGGALAVLFFGIAMKKETGSAK